MGNKRDERGSAHAVATRSPRALAVAALLLLATIALKLSWGDYRSWLYGILLGAVLGTVYQRAGTKTELAKSRGLR